MEGVRSDNKQTDSFYVSFAAVHILRLSVLRPPWSLFRGGCNLTLMCCELET